jgi:hypothetical protein
MHRDITGLKLAARLFLYLCLGGLSGGCPVLSVNSTANQTENTTISGTGTNHQTVENTAAAPTDPQQREILWDFRKTDDSRQTFSKAETKVVFSYLFGSSWDRDLEITSRVNGAFTGPNANETLYYVGGCDEGQGFVSTSNCAHASWWNAGKIAIYNGQTPVMKIDAPLGYIVAKVSDVNSDGINEILSLSGYSNSGATETGASLGQIKNGKYRNIYSITGYSDYCDGGESSKPVAKAAVVSYLPATNGKMPAFTEEYFQNQCRDTPWKKITKKQFAGE